MNRLNNKLSRNIKKEEQERYVKQMEKLFDFIDPINLTLKQEIDKIIKDKTKEKDFDCAGWAYKQAYLNGQLQAYQLVLSILKLKNTDQVIED